MEKHLSISNFQNETGKLYTSGEKYTLHFDFEEFYKVYFDSLSKDILKNDEIKKQKSVVSISQQNRRSLKYEYCELENCFLFNYFYYLNNFCETRPREEIFMYDKISKINTFPSIKSSDISDLIEKEFLNFSNLNIDNFIIYSLINLLMIFIAENRSSELYLSMKEIYNLINNRKIYIRKYLELIMSTYIDPRFSENCKCFQI